jgi:hypothetical protein
VRRDESLAAHRGRVQSAKILTIEHEPIRRPIIRTSDFPGGSKPSAGFPAPVPLTPSRLSSKSASTVQNGGDR